MSVRGIPARSIAFALAISVTAAMSISPATAFHDPEAACLQPLGPDKAKQNREFWLEKAQDGDAEAQFCVFIVSMFLIPNLETAATERREAQRWLEKSASQKYGPAEEALASELMWPAEPGSRKDEERAAELMRSAASKGSVTANYSLGIWLLNGLATATDRTEAYRRLSLALELARRDGDRGVLEVLEHFALPGVAEAAGRSLTDRDRDEADAWVRNWTAQK